MSRNATKEKSPDSREATRTVKVWIGLGSNQQHPVLQVNRALAWLDELSDSPGFRHSSLHRTRPWGVADQPDFINAVAVFETRLEPTGLLDRLQFLEDRAGRLRRGHQWGPRVLDLDILLYGSQSIRTERLEIPHPRTGQRAFVLAPMVELDPGVEIPGQGRAMSLLERIGDSDILATEPARPFAPARTPEQESPDE